MPCRDDWDDRPPHSPATRHGLTIADFEATLCSLFAQLERQDVLDSWLNNVDWQEAGVNRKNVEQWWTKHKLEDQRRRAEEQAKREIAKLKKAALAKLTPEERTALGL
jgi:hypothetical protein